MYKGGSRLLPIALVVIVTIVAIVALVSVGKALLGRGDAQEAIQENPATQSLLNSEIDRGVRMTVRGPIIADEEFNSYQIEISPVARRMTTYRGYEQEVIDTTRLDNSTEGYEEFVYALEKVNFTKEGKVPDTFDDMRGICATGRLYTFELLLAQSVTKDLWVSSCRKVPGTFGGDASAARDLFLKQIPDSDTLIRGLNL